MTEEDSAQPVMKYAGAALDRAGARREDSAWLDAIERDPAARLLPVWRDRNLVSGLADASPAAGHWPIESGAQASSLIFLGLQGRAPIFAADFSDLDEDRARQLAGTGRFVDLRRVGPLLGSDDAGLLAYARGMVHWHRHHLFCGRCGSETSSVRGGHLRVCANRECARSLFPRTDPAMIVLVEGVAADGSPRCLLGRSGHFPPGGFSTLAGFVEPGESLEETVRREVLEESGIEVGQVHYRASQPWPFPSSLMIGFHATALTSEIRLHDNELEDARWFAPDELRDAAEWGDAAPLSLPRQDSIARFLIQSWLERQPGGR